MLLCFPGAAIAAFALAVCLLCTSFLRGAALWSMSTVNQCRSILGDKVWMALALWLFLGDVAGKEQQQGNEH